MNFLNNLLNKVFPPFQPISPGIYHYQAPPDAEFPYRLHLRIENDGEGILIVNASTVLHLNQTATEYAFHLVNQTPDSEVSRQVKKRYRISAQQALDDYQDLVEKIEILINTPDLDPVTFLDFERQEPYSAQSSIPYRLDCALTYKVVENNLNKDVVPGDRVRRELLTDEWKSILSKSWDFGIPHIIFTGGEPTLRPDLVELIAHAEKLGQVTGLLTDGLRLSEPDYLDQLLTNGLDHVMIVFDPKEEQAWEALRDALAADIYITVHLTLTKALIAQIDPLLEKLKSMGVHSLSISTDVAEIKEKMSDFQQTIANKNLELHWDIPVPYSNFNPVSLELEDTGESVKGAGKAWMYVEPDGDVLEAQGMPKVLGNLLENDWQDIIKSV